MGHLEARRFHLDCMEGLFIVSKWSVMDRPHVTLMSSVRKVQDLAQKIHISEEAQEEAEVSARVAGLTAHRRPKSRCTRDE